MCCGIVRGSEVVMLDFGRLEVAFGAIWARVALELRRGLVASSVGPCHTGWVPLRHGVPQIASRRLGTREWSHGCEKNKKQHTLRQQ